MSHEVDALIEAVQRTQRVISDVVGERGRQLRKWGDQSHPNMALSMPAPIPAQFSQIMGCCMADEARQMCEDANDAGHPNWANILNEEFCEAMEQVGMQDEAALRKELIQVAAVAVSWVEDIDRKATIAAMLEKSNK